MEGVSVEAIQEGGRLSKEGAGWSEGSQTFASRQDLVARGGDDILEGILWEGIEKIEERSVYRSLEGKTRGGKESIKVGEIRWKVGREGMRAGGGAGGAGEEVGGGNSAACDLLQSGTPVRVRGEEGGCCMRRGQFCETCHRDPASGRQKFGGEK